MPLNLNYLAPCKYTHQTYMRKVPERTVFFFQVPLIVDVIIIQFVHCIWLLYIICCSGFGGLLANNSSLHILQIKDGIDHLIRLHVWTILLLCSTLFHFQNRISLLLPSVTAPAFSEASTLSHDLPRDFFFKFTGASGMRAVISWQKKMKTAKMGFWTYDLLHDLRWKLTPLDCSTTIGRQRGLYCFYQWLRISIGLSRQ